MKKRSTRYRKLEVVSVLIVLFALALLFRADPHDTLVFMQVQ